VALGLSNVRASFLLVAVHRQPPATVGGVPFESAVWRLSQKGTALCETIERLGVRVEGGTRPGRARARRRTRLGWSGQDVRAGSSDPRSQDVRYRPSAFYPVALESPDRSGEPSTGRKFIHLNNKDGTFLPAGISPDFVSCIGCDLLVADFTGDGYADYADRNPYGGLIYIMENPRVGPWTRTAWGYAERCADDSQAGRAAPCDVLVGDFTGDGLLTSLSGPPRNTVCAAESRADGRSIAALAGLPQCDAVVGELTSMSFGRMRDPGAPIPMRPTARGGTPQRAPCNMLRVRRCCG
jgi:hypothetical protein